MPATVVLYDRIEATVSDLVWECPEDKIVEDVLNSMTGLCQQDPAGAWQGGGANLDYHCALWMTENFPGKAVLTHFDVPDVPQFAEDGRQIVY